jgi:callose synthase
VIIQTKYAIEKLFNGYSLLDSVQGGSNRHEGMTPLDQQDQLFTKAIKFPVDSTDAWNEKVLYFSALLQ